MAVVQPLFTPVRLQKGYSQPEVDDVVDQLLDDLSRDDPRLTRRWVESLQITTVRMQEAYNKGQVDRWLGDVAYELDRRHAAAVSLPGTTTAPAGTEDRAGGDPGRADQAGAEQPGAEQDADDQDTAEHEPIAAEVADPSQDQQAVTEVKEGFPTGLLVLAAVVVLLLLFLLLG